MRVIFGCVVAILVAALFGLILGEYQLRGVMALVAGLLFGLAVAEAAITVGKSNDWSLVAVSGAASFLGFSWAAYIDAGDTLEFVETVRWVGAALALVSAAWWVRAFGARAVRSLFGEEPPAPSASS